MYHVLVLRQPCVGMASLAYNVVSAPPATLSITLPSRNLIPLPPQLQRVPALPLHPGTLTHTRCAASPHVAAAPSPPPSIQFKEKAYAPPRSVPAAQVKSN